MNGWCNAISGVNLAWGFQRKHAPTKPTNGSSSQFIACVSGFPLYCHRLPFESMTGFSRSFLVKKLLFLGDFARNDLAGGPSTSIIDHEFVSDVGDGVCINRMTDGGDTGTQTGWYRADCVTPRMRWPTQSTSFQLVQGEADAKRSLCVVRPTYVI